MNKQIFVTSPDGDVVVVADIRLSRKIIDLTLDGTLAADSVAQTIVADIRRNAAAFARTTGDVRLLVVAVDKETRDPRG